MKLVFTKRTLPHGQCIKADWLPGSRDISWTSLFHVPTEEDKLKGWSVGDELDEIFLEFLRCCRSSGSHTYALLAPSTHEYGRMVDDLQMAGLQHVQEKDLARHRQFLPKLLKTTDTGYIYVADVDWRPVSSWYKNYVGWSSVPYMFLVAPKFIENWVKELARLQGHILEREFLKQFNLVAWNHFDHGVEAAGLHVSVDALEATAKVLAQKLNIALEIRETGQPF